MPRTCDRSHVTGSPNSSSAPGPSGSRADAPVARYLSSPTRIAVRRIRARVATGHLTVGQKITFDAAHGVDATNGAEQPVWEPVTGRFYLSIPQIGPLAKDGAVARIDPETAAVEVLFPVEFCQPAGLAAPHSGDKATRRRIGKPGSARNIAV